MQTRGPARIETVEAFINGRMSARASSHDRGSSFGEFAAQCQSRLAHGLPRSNDGELRNPVEKRDLRCFKMGRRIKTFDLADEPASGLCGGSEGWRRKAGAPRNQRIPIVLRRLSNR